MCGALPLPPTCRTKRLGIIGLGTIAKIAQRALGWSVVGYHGRSARHRCAIPLLPMWRWPVGGLSRHRHARRRRRKRWSTAGADTLGPRGVVVNIARGSVMFPPIQPPGRRRLREGRIAAAGWMYESEACAPTELLDLDNVVLTPMWRAGRPEAVQNSVNRFMENARRHLAGEAPVTPL